MSQEECLKILKTKSRKDKWFRILANDLHDEALKIENLESSEEDKLLQLTVRLWDFFQELGFVDEYYDTAVREYVKQHWGGRMSKTRLMEPYKAKRALMLFEHRKEDIEEFHKFAQTLYEEIVTDMAREMTTKKRFLMMRVRLRDFLYEMDISDFGDEDVWDYVEMRNAANIHNAMVEIFKPFLDT